ncbi:MAG: hypothetical protein K2Q18_17915 [Bdellovibrionales bacterium]|nr:hypothetical protein [Bdellovibrionales bacterium]
MKLKSLLAIISALVLSSCASTPNVDANRARNVQKVAIVAFEIGQEKATDNLGISAIKSMAEGEDKDSWQLQGMATNVVNTVAAKIQKTTQWKVSPMTEVVANKDYKALVDASAKSGNGVFLSAMGKTFTINPKGMMDSTSFRKLSDAQRKELAKSLGVDALAEVVLFNNMEQSFMSFGHVSGDAAFAFTGTANLQVYGLDSKDPIWRSQNVKGERTEKSSTLSGAMSKRERIAALAEKASTSAIDKLMERYKF